MPDSHDSKNRRILIIDDSSAIHEDFRKILGVAKGDTTVDEATADAIIITDEQGEIQSFNKSAEAIFGYSRDEVCGRNLSMLVPPCDHDEYIRQFDQFRQAPCPGLFGRRNRGQELPGNVCAGTGTPAGCGYDPCAGRGQGFGDLGTRGADH